MTHPIVQVSNSTVDRAPSFRAAEEQHFATFLRLLNTHGVDFLVTGSHAASFHGCPDFEQDADLVIRPTRENVLRLKTCLTAFGFGDLGVSARDFVGNAMVTVVRAPYRFDLVTYIAGVELEAAWSRRIAGPLATVPVHFIAREDFVQSKRATGRPEDLARLAS